MSTFCPDSIECLQRRPTLGHYTKVIITYQTAFWRQAGLNGSFVDSLGPIDCGFDACTLAGEPALVLFICANDAIYLTDMPKAGRCGQLADFDSRSAQEFDWRVERKSQILETLSKFFGEQALTPIAFVEKNWQEEPFNGGCPVFHLGPGILSEHGDVLRAPFERIHWAGNILM